jgi:acetyltransferase-like isoleucine patch superfamily enzyme
VDCAGATHSTVHVDLRGANNTLIIEPGAKLGKLTVEFDCNNATVRIGPNTGVSPFTGFLRLGEDATIILGKNVSSTGPCFISAVEGTTVTLGDDVMLASENEIRADDAHPMFDVGTGLRINPARDIVIGNHVWVAKRAVLLGGAAIGDGSVLGYGSILKGIVPNNSVAAGSPAKVVRRDIAWERPHLSLARPYYKPDAETVTKSAFWNVTEEVSSS